MLQNISSTASRQPAAKERKKPVGDYDLYRFTNGAETEAAYRDALELVDIIEYRLKCHVIKDRDGVRLKCLSQVINAILEGRIERIFCTGNL